MLSWGICGSVGLGEGFGLDFCVVISFFGFRFGGVFFGGFIFRFFFAFGFLFGGF